MGANYQKFLDRGAAAVDKIHGELVRFDPKIVDQYSGAVDDGNRIQFEMVGVLRVETGEVSDLGQGKRQRNVSIGTGDAVFHVARTRVPGGGTFQTGDHVTALNRDGSPKYEIVRVNNRGHARMEIELAAIGSQNA